MGGKQSRVETSEARTELHGEGEVHDGPAKTSISVTPALRDQIHELQTGAAPAKPQQPQQQEAVLTPEQEAAFKEELRKAYLKGVEDHKKQVDIEKQRTTQVDSAKLARLAKEQEAREDARVQQLVKELNQKKYRAPLSDVQCAPERDACLQCYREKGSDILQCREVADAFIRCAQQTTEKFVKEN
ncbi:hypothetical protein ATCC90586_003954 [Pythium insidiosum]|nr:hypothetical protein ATCC90586_003954 [Pythium insidiosum]